MIILDTTKCPVELKYERPNTWDTTGMRIGVPYIRQPEKDIFQLKYKNNILTILPFKKEITIDGDIKEMAFGLALFINGTLSTLDMGKDIINEAFTFSEKGLIIEWWQIEKDM